MRYGLSAGILWAVDTVILTFALGMEPLASAALATIISAAVHDIACGAIMGVYSTMAGKWLDITVALRGRGKLLCIAALLGGPIGMTGYVVAVQNLGGGYAAIMSVMFPAVGALASRLILKDGMTWTQYICLVLAIIGIAILLWTPNEQVTNMPLGIAGGIICIIGWASEGVICSFALGDDSVDSVLALSIREITSGLAYIVVAIAIATVSGGFEADTNSMLVIAIAALMGTLSYLYYYKAIDTLGTGRAMALDMTYSIWTPILCVFVFAQYLSILQWLLIVAILACSLIAGNNRSEIRALMHWRKG